MSHDMLIFLVIAAVFLIFLTGIEFMYRKLSFSVEFSRKAIHIIAGGISSTFIFIFEWMATAICLAIFFFIVIWYSKKKGWLRSMHSVKRESIGVFIFPLSLGLIFVLTRAAGLPGYSYSCSALVLSFSDPLASLGGFLNLKANNNTKWVITDRPNKLKTWPGSVLFFISTFLIVFLTILIARNLHLLLVLATGLLIALVATLAELFSYKGWDNLTAPLTVWLTLYLFECLYF